MATVTVASGAVSLYDQNDAKAQAMFIASSQQKTVIFDGVTSYTPNYATSNQVLTPQLYVAGTSTDLIEGVTACRWYYQINGTGTKVLITAATTGYTLEAIGTSPARALKITTNILAANRSVNYLCELDYMDTDTQFSLTTTASIELVKVTNGTDGVNGKDAVLATLSNDSHDVPANDAGTVLSLAGATSQMYIYEGTTDVTTSYKITQTVVGATVTASGTPENKIATLTAMSADVATVTFTATRSGYATMTRVFTISKVRGGAAGVAATVYRLSVPVQTIKKSETGVFTPSTMAFSATSVTGAAAPVSYSGRFTVEETTNGTTWAAARYTSAAAELGNTYAPTATAVALRVTLYLAAGITEANKRDTQIIPIISDGFDAGYLSVWTPNGNSVKNGVGSIVIQADMYKGSSLTTATAYQWYYQDPTATTTSGGNAAGGNGWRLVTSATTGITGYNTKALTVAASFINGTESFKCVATYNGINYAGVSTITVLDDPIVVQFQGVTVFLNGKGEITMKALPIREGVDVDPEGTLYNYNWSLYNSSLVKQSGFAKTGKTITVFATEVDKTASLNVDISLK